MARRLLRIQFSRSEEPLTPTLSPRRAGRGRRKINARGNRAYFPFSPCGRRWRGRSPRRLRGLHPQRAPRLRFAKAPSPTGGEANTSAPLAEPPEKFPPAQDTTDTV